MLLNNKDFNLKKCICLSVFLHLPPTMKRNIEMYKITFMQFLNSIMHGLL